MKKRPGKAKVSDDPDLVLNQIGLRVQRRRQELGLTQKGFAERLEITTTNIHRIEHGQQNVTIRTLCRVAEALGVTLAELVVGPLKRQDDGR